MARYRKIRLADVEVVAVRGSGPGGQHRNKRWTGIRATHLPTGIVALATERRSQADNRKIALERLDEKVARHFYRPPRRRKTRPTGASREKRLQEKGRRSDIKKMRQGVKM